MAWATAPAPRADLLFESYVLLDGSGSFTGPWVDTADVYNILVAANLVDSSDGTLTIQEAIYPGSASYAPTAPQLIRSQAVTLTSGLGAGELDISSRWFRIEIGSSSLNGYCAVTVRKVPS